MYPFYSLVKSDSDYRLTPSRCDSCAMQVSNLRLFANPEISLPFVRYSITTMRDEKISHFRHFHLRAVSNSRAGSRPCGRQKKESASTGTEPPYYLKRHRKFGHRDQKTGNQNVHRDSVHRDQCKWTKRDDCGPQVGHDGERDDWRRPYSRRTRCRLGPALNNRGDRLVACVPKVACSASLFR
jgi:hypothetical protein